MEEILDLIEGGDEMRKFSDYFQLIKLLGRGAFGVVVHARNLTTDQEVAIKIVTKKSLLTNEFNQLQQEAMILSSLRHKNIVKFIDFKETDLRILIIMEYLNGGSLQDLMYKKHKNNEWFSEEQSKFILRSILEALAYIHEKNIVHRDLKPDNILISDDLSCVKLGDFGLSVGYKHEIHMKKQCGTITYMAPELLQNKVYSKAVDIWSAGIIMYNLLFKGQHPYYEQGDSIEKILEKMKNLNQHKYAQFTQTELSLYRKLTDLDQSKRYAANQGLYHPWLNDQKDDVPQTMEEMFQTWQSTQNFLQLIKTVMILIKMGYNKKLDHLKICNDMSLIQNKFVQEKHKKEGRISQINKEFYDELFDDYQKILTESQRKQVEKIKARRPSQIRMMSIIKLEISNTSDTTISNSPPLPQKTTPTKFIIKTLKLQQQNSIIIPEELLENQPHTSPQQTPFLEGDRNSFSIIENDEQVLNSTQNNIPSPQKSPTKKKRPNKRPQMKLLIQRTDSINQSQEESKQEKTYISHPNSPVKPRPTIISKFKIQLKPLPTLVETNTNINTNFVNNQLRESQFASAIRPRQQSIQNRISRIERDKIVPNVLDMTSMALGSVSPVQNNQFLFPTRNNSISQPAQIKRLYPNEFHPSKILSNKKQVDLFYNFINGGPK